MPYRAPVEDFAFLFDHVVGLDAVRQTERFEDASEDVTRAILEAHGGSASAARAEPGATGGAGGAEFTLLLPRP